MEDLQDTSLVSDTNIVILYFFPNVSMILYRYFHDLFHLCAVV